MDFSDLNDAIAAVAHRCWCKRMLEDGWRPGKIFDAEAKIHDEIRPYDQLSAFCRAKLRRQVGWDELDKDLAKSAADALMCPEFSAHDLYVGMRVRFVDDPAGDIGRVIGWEGIDEETGMIESITVEWPNGEVVEYAPNDEAITPVDEA